MPKPQVEKNTELKKVDKRLFSEIVKSAQARSRRAKEQEQILMEKEKDPSPEQVTVPAEPIQTEVLVAEPAPPELPPNPQEVVSQLYMLAVFAESFRTQRRCLLVHSQVYFRHLKTYMDFYRQVVKIIRHRESSELAANQASVFSYLGYSEQYQQQFETTKKQLDLFEQKMDEHPSLRTDWSDMGPELNAKYPELRFTPVLLPVYGSAYSPTSSSFGQPVLPILKEKKKKEEK